MLWRIALLILLLTTPALAQPSVVTSSGGVTASGTSHTLTMPSGIVSGNLLLAILSPNNPITGLTLLSGWTKMTDCSSYAVGSHGVETWYRHATGDANDNMTVTSTGTGTVAYTIRRITGHLAATAPECSPIISNTSTAPNPSALVPAAGLANYLWIAVTAFDTTPIPQCSVLSGSVGGSTTDAASYQTGSVTLTSNRMYLAYAATGVSSGTAIEPTVTLTGAGTPWTSVFYESGGSVGLTVFRMMLSATQTDTLTIATTGQTQANIRWGILECTGTDVSGTNGSGAVVTTNRNDVGSSPLTLTFAAYGSANNRPVVGTLAIGTNLAEWSLNWTSLSEQVSGNIILTLGWRDATDDTTTAETSTGTVSRILGIGVEVKGLTGNATVSTYPTDYDTNQRNDGGANGTRIASATRTTTATSENPGPFALDLAETWYAFPIAIRPSGAGSSPPAGFRDVTGNSWTQAGGVATPINGFSVIQWDTASGPAQQALWPITTIPGVGETVQASFRIESPTQRYRCVATRNADADDDTMTLQSITAGLVATLAGPKSLGVDIQANDEIGVDVTAGGAISCIYRSVDAAWATLCAGGGDYCIIVTGQATTNPATSYIGMGAAPPVTATSFSGTLSAPGGGLPAPSVPANCVMTTTSNTSVLLICDPSTGTVAGYRDRFCVGADCTPTEQIRDSPATSWPVTDLTAVTNYCFDRCAHDGVTCSSFSTKACTTTTDAPAASLRGTRMMLGVGH